MEGPSRFHADDSISFDEVALMAELGYLAGYVRRRDGSLYVTVLTDLGYEVNGAMFDW